MCKHGQEEYAIAALSLYIWRVSIVRQKSINLFIQFKLRLMYFSYQIQNSPEKYISALLYTDSSAQFLNPDMM